MRVEGEEDRPERGVVVHLMGNDGACVRKGME